MKIIKPSIGGHGGCSFRELLDMWVERGFCEIEKGPEQRSTGYNEDPDSPEAKCWIEKQGGILLYDFPILDRLKNEYEMCLFANTYKEGEKNKKWIFWPKHSRLYEKKKKELRQNTKKYNCGFIGAPTNYNRNSIAEYWSKNCDLFHLGRSILHEDYLQYCSQFTFGLCLPGVGPKCLRDVEYMGMGVIPIIVDKNAVDLYYDPPVENEHYIFVQDIDEMISKIDDLLCNKNNVRSMSEACIDWFNKNCSIEGSFKTTMEIINE